MNNAANDCHSTALSAKDLPVAVPQERPSDVRPGQAQSQVHRPRVTRVHPRRRRKKYRSPASRAAARLGKRSYAKKLARFGIEFIRDECNERLRTFQFQKQKPDSQQTGERGG